MLEEHPELTRRLERAYGKDWFQKLSPAFVALAYSVLEMYGEADGLSPADYAYELPVPVQ